MFFYTSLDNDNNSLVPKASNIEVLGEPIKNIESEWSEGEVAIKSVMEASPKKDREIMLVVDNFYYANMCGLACDLSDDYSIIYCTPTTERETIINLKNHYPHAEIISTIDGGVDDVRSIWNDFSAENVGGYIHTLHRSGNTFSLYYAENIDDLVTTLKNYINN